MASASKSDDNDDGDHFSDHKLCGYLRAVLMLISHKKDNLYGEYEEVMDAGMVPYL